MKLKSTKQWLTGLNRLKIYPLSIKCRRGFPWQSSGYDLALPLQVGELRSFMPCGGTNKSNDSENSQKAGCSGLVCKGQEVIRDLLSAAHALPCLVCCRVSPHPCGPRGLLEFQHRIFRSVKWMQGWQPQQQYLELSFVMTTHTLASHGFFLFFFSHASQTHLSIWSVLTLFLNPEEGGLKSWNKCPCWGRYTDTKVRISFRRYFLVFELQKGKKAAASTANVPFESFTSSIVGSRLFIYYLLLFLPNMITYSCYTWLLEKHSTQPCLSHMKKMRPLQLKWYSQDHKINVDTNL